MIEFLPFFCFVGLVHGVIGELGGGKTYGMVRDAINHMLNGGIVLTNIEIFTDKVAEHYKVDPEELKQFYYLIDPEEDPWSWMQGDPRGPGSRRVMLIIDETADWFGNMEDRRTLKDFFVWLRKSDKRGQDVYFICHEPSLLAKGARIMVKRWIHMRDMTQWRIPKLGWKLPPPWKHEFHRMEFDAMSNTKIGRHIHVRDKRIFDCYESAAMVGSHAMGSNAYDLLEVDKPSKVKKKKEKEEKLGLWFHLFNTASLSAFWLFFEVLM